MMPADTTTADAFADGQRKARETNRVALVTALGLPADTTWERALSSAMRVARERDHLTAGINAVIDHQRLGEDEPDVLYALERAFGVVRDAAGSSGNLAEDLCRAAGVDPDTDDPVESMRAAFARVRHLIRQERDGERQIDGEPFMRREPRMSGGDNSPTVAVMCPAEAILPLRDAGIARESEPAPPVTTIYDVEGDL